MRSEYRHGMEPAPDSLAAPVSQAPPPAAAAPFCPPHLRRNVLAAAILASALGFIDGSVVSVAMPAIRADLAAGLTAAQWISNAYALTLSALILVGGGAGDRFGLKRTFTAGIVFFVAASLICAAAPDAASLIAARALQGIGAALMIPGSLAIIAKAYPKAERGRAIGIWAAASALTTALGPVVGGFAISLFGDTAWRGIFAINLPLGLVAIVLLSRIPADRPSERKRLDLGGAALAILAFGALAYGLTAAVEDSGDAAPGQAALVILVGLVLLAAFVVFELRRAEPMVDLGLFRIVAFAGANAATFALYFALSGILFYLPMLLIAAWKIDAATAGFVFLPLSVAIAALSGAVGRLSDRLGARVPMTVGSLIVATAFAGLAVVVGSGIHAFWTAVFPAMVLMGLGMAFVVSPLSAAVMTSVEDKDTGSASGINNAVSRIAGLVAVAAMGSVATWLYAGMLPAGIGAVPGFGEIAAQLPTEVEAARLMASNRAFAGVAAVMAGLCVISAALSWTTQPVAVSAAGVEKQAGPG